MITFRVGLVLAAFAACGDVNETMTPDAGSADAGVDTTSPTIVSIVPADGATGVSADAVVTITFSEPMDPLSVQTSIAASDLGAVTYAWTDNNTKVTITPTNELAYATGTNPTSLAALQYTVIIGTGGQDEAGNTVAAGMQSTFSTYKAITLTLPRVDALTATGEPGSIVSTSGDLYAGDDGQGATAKGQRAYITMNLATIPSTASQIESATLATLSTGSDGTPFVDLGTLILDHTTYAVASNNFATATSNEINGAFNAAALSSVGNLMTNDTSVPSIDVTAQVRDDVANRAARSNRSQYRARMATDLNLDNNRDGVLLSRSMLALTVVYLTP